LVDAAGHPVCDALLWLDRARFSPTETGLTACQQDAQLNWMRTAMPDAFSRAATAFHCKDWLYL
jgi:erythritol kinase